MTLVVTLPTLDGDDGLWDEKLNTAIAAIVNYVNNLEVSLGASSEASIALFLGTAGGWSPAIPSSAPAGIRLFIFVGPTQATGLPGYIGNDVSAGQIPSLYFYAPTT